MVTKLTNLFLLSSGASVLMLLVGGMASWMIFKDGTIFWPLVGVCLCFLGVIVINYALFSFR
jgi:hypothetical protein